MKTALVMTIAALLAATLLAAPASGATPAERRLARQVKTLQKQVKTLTARIAKTEDQLDANFAGDTCLGAQTTDLIQSTWGVIDLIAQALQSRTYFGAQTAVDDYQNCSSLRTPQVPRQGIVPAPKIGFFQVLLQWLHVSV